MVDSAKICLTESRAKKNSSAEIEISWLLTEAVIDQVTANENAAAIHYDSAFRFQFDFHDVEQRKLRRTLDLTVWVQVQR